MDTYRIRTPSITALIIVDDDIVTQAPTALSWAVGRSFVIVRDHCVNRGWTIEPLLSRTTELRYSGSIYNLHWQEDQLVRITLTNEDGSRDIRFDELPLPLQQII